MNFIINGDIKMDYENIAKDIGRLVEEKQMAYGDSFNKSEQILKILYPNGIQFSQYKDVLCVVRIVDKIFRIATDKDAFGESPYKDIVGYALLGFSSTIKENL